MSIPPEGSEGVSDLQRSADQESGDRSRTLERLPERDPGRFSLLLIDNVTGEEALVDLWPVRLDTILLSHRSQRLVSGWLMAKIGETAERLLGGFTDSAPAEAPHRIGHPAPANTRQDAPGRRYDIGSGKRSEQPSGAPFTPRWRKWLIGDDDDGGV